MPKSDHVEENGMDKDKEDDMISNEVNGVPPIQFYEEEIEPNDEQKMQIPQLKNKNIEGFFDQDQAIEEAVWSNDDADENGRGFIFPDSDLNKPIE